MSQPQIKVAPNEKSDADREQELADELKKKHGISKVHVFSNGDHTVFVRMPAAAIWRRFRSQMQDPRKRDEAGEGLLRACLLHPDQAGLNAMIEEMPGCLDSFAAELCALAGLSKDVEKKVL